jgi:hypothetical protein
MPTEPFLGEGSKPYLARLISSPSDAFSQQPQALKLKKKI